jgi:hypothetical protein
LNAPRELDELARIDTETLRIIAHNIRTPEQLRQALRLRADGLDIARTALDQIAGLQDGYSAKLLAPRALKGLGAVSMPLLLEALGVRLVLVEDREAFERIRSRLEPRHTNALRETACLWAGKARITVSKRWVKRIARAGGHARAAALTPARRRAIARRAAMARWRKPKVVEVNGPF